MLALINHGVSTLKATIEEARAYAQSLRNTASETEQVPAHTVRSQAGKKQKRSGGADSGRPTKVPRPAPVGRPRFGTRVHIMQANLRDGFVVLHNNGRDSADLGGWSLRGGESGSTVYKIPVGTTLEARSSLVLLAPGAETPEPFKHESIKELRSSRSWPDALLVHNANGSVVDGEADIDSTYSAPYGTLIRRAENYYRDLVSQLVSQRLFVKSPGMVGPTSVSAQSVRFTHDTRLHLCALLEQFAGHLMRACTTEDGGLATATSMCSAVEDALPGCDVQRRAIAEVARSAEHTDLFLLTDEDAQKVAEAHARAAGDTPQLAVDAVHALAVAMDYFLVELIETVATIAYGETTTPGSQGDAHTQTSDFCVSVLDKLGLQMAIRIDPDLHKICAAVDSRPGLS
mmetsp:Transcript_20104/g.51799  ORF Transcript_20104/g.51799 Transcript_20104/m.51799 type:complete len:402 (+) Transcript_20104:71-1276(+)